MRVLVFDIGTSSVKAVLFDDNAAICADAEVPYRTEAHADGRQEQSALDWIEATKLAARRVAGEARGIAAIVLSGTMQSVIPVDAAGTPIGPAILYSDGRATAELADLQPQFSKAVRRIGNLPNEYMAAFKIEWLRRHEPDLFSRAATFHSGAKDVVAHWMTGVAATDPTAASTVGLMDLGSRLWDQDLAAAIGLSVDRLPRILPADTELGVLGSVAAGELGLPSGIPVLNGAGDAGASTLGAGIDASGDAYVYVGTTAWIAQVAEVSDVAGNDPSPSFYTLAHPTDRNRVIRIGAMLSGGDTAAWYSELLGRTLHDLDAMVSAPGFEPSGAMFLPYLKGERCPFMDSGVRGGLVGIGRSDGAGELHHAVIEGIALAIRTNLDALGGTTGDILMLGGGALSAHLPQLLADSLELPIAIAEAPSSVTALGCFRLAARRGGLADSKPAVASRLLPRAGSAARTAARLRLFKEATVMQRKLAQLR